MSTTISSENNKEKPIPKPGECLIKPEFLDLSLKRKLINCDDNDELSEKNTILDNSKEEKIKRKGQNKSRPKTHIDRTKLACSTIINVKPNDEARTCTYPNCIFLHDPLECLNLKPNDLGSECYVYKTNGFCPRGINCRFGSEHLTPDGKNIYDTAKADLYEEKTYNSLQSDVQRKLYKKNYDFSKAEAIVNQIETKKTEDKTEKPIGCIENELKEKKSIEWTDKLYLAPLTTVGNLPFRRICKEFGADITCGEMAFCNSILQARQQEWALLKRHSTEDIFGVQICGYNKYLIAKTVQLIENETQVDFVDLNLGCPIDLIYKKGAGAGMLQRLPTLEASIRAASQILSCPFTVKTRTGISENAKIAHQLMPKFFQWGASFVTIHGRSREGRYIRQADWKYIEECAKACSPNPVFGNGDILSYEDYKEHRESAPSVKGVMIGRGALIKPWIFTEIKEQRLWDVRSSERMDIIKKFVNYGLEHWGSDTQGVENTRRFLLEWLSFLYRYIPVGVLEQPPQKMNERPPKYIGRDDLETLMASSNCADWIKISEMLLGPVPDGFQFLPKHKANSY